MYFSLKLQKCNNSIDGLFTGDPWHEDDAHKLYFQKVIFSKKFTKNVGLIT